MTVPARISSLPWLVVSERGGQFTRQGIAYSSATLEPAPSSVTCGRTCCATRAAITSPT